MSHVLVGSSNRTIKSGIVSRTELVWLNEPQLSVIRSSQCEIDNTLRILGTYSGSVLRCDTICDSELWKARVPGVGLIHEYPGMYFLFYR